MEPTVFTRAALALLLADLLQGTAVAAAHLFAPVIHLFTNNVDPGETAVVGDFTEATFGGYAATAVGAWGEVFLDSDGYPLRVAPNLQLDWDSGVAETIYGFYLVSAVAGTPLLGYGRLLVPKDMATTLDSIVISPRMKLSPVGFGAFART